MKTEKEQLAYLRNFVTCAGVAVVTPLLWGAEQYAGSYPAASGGRVPDYCYYSAYERRVG